MKISIIHPSRNRPKLASDTAKKWLTSARDRANIEYIVSLDTTDTHLQEYKELMPNDVQYLISDNKTAVEAINIAAKQSTGDLLIVVSDDFACPALWDFGLMVQLKSKSDFIVKTYDGAQPWIITLPIMDREYYNRFGYIYYPEYQHMFCDTEMTHVADLLGRKIHVAMTFRHNHYTTGAMAKDAINAKNDRTWGQGELLYLKRLRDNFGLTEYSGSWQCDSGHLNWLRSKGVSI